MLSIVKLNYKKDKEKGVISLLPLLLVLLIHPLISIAMMAVINLVMRVRFMVLQLWCFMYAGYVVNREYMVRFSTTGSDDTYVYIPHILSLKGLHVMSLYDSRYMLGPDIIPQIFWWMTINMGISVDGVLYLQLVIWILLLCYLAHRVSERYAAAVLFVGMFFMSGALLYLFFHLYRAAWGFAFVAYGLTVIKKNKSTFGFYLALMSHMSMIFFIIIDAFRRLNGKAFFIGIIGAFLVFVYLDQLGFMRFLFLKYDFYMNAPDSREFNFISVFLGMGLIVYNYFYSKKEDAQFLMVILALFLIFLSFVPGFNPIVDRLILVVIPLTVMVCFPINNKVAVYFMVVFSIYRLVYYYYSNNSLFRFIENDLFFGINVPLYNILSFFVFGG